MTQRYSFAANGTGDDFGFRGNHLLKSGIGDVSLWQPSWKGGPTVFRPFPVLDPDNQSAWHPWRVGGGAGEFGDWIRRYEAVANMGNDGVTFFTHDPMHGDLDKAQSPAHVLYRAIDQAVGAGQAPGHWAPLLRGSPGTSAELKKPTYLYVIQCAVMSHKGKVYSPPKGGASNDGTIVMVLKSSAGRALVTQMNQQVEGYAGDPNDFNAMFQSGDVVSLNPGHGRYVCVYNLEEDPKAVQAPQMGYTQGASQQAAFGQAAQQGMTETKGDDKKGYGIYIEPIFNNCGADMSDPVMQQLVASKVKPWDDILNFPSPAQQAHWLAVRFPADAIMYAYGGHPDWIPESVRAAAQQGAQAPVAQAPAAAPAPPTFGAPTAAPPVPPQVGQPAPAAPQPGAPAWPAAPGGAPAPVAPMAAPPIVAPAGQPAAPQWANSVAPPAAPVQAAPPQAAPPQAAPPTGPGWGAAQPVAPAAAAPPQYAPDPSLPPAHVPVPGPAAPTIPINPTAATPPPTAGFEAPPAAAPPMAAPPVQVAPAPAVPQPAAPTVPSAAGSNIAALAAQRTQAG